MAASRQAGTCGLAAPSAKGLWRRWATPPHRGASLLKGRAMANAANPDIRPHNPDFSSGPCAKRPGWSLAALSGALLGRSHRAKEPKARLVDVIEQSRKILGMPADWKLG